MTVSLFIGIYLLAIIALGFWKRNKKQSDEEYILASRKLSLPAFVMTLVTTWYGAILGVGEFVFGYGVVGWVTQGLFWYVVYFLFAYFFSKRIHDSGHTTVADHVREYAGDKSATLSAVITYIMTSPAPYLLSLGLIVTMLFGFPILWSVVVGAVVSGLYVWFQGFRAVVRTDILQFVFMFLGFGMLMLFSVMQFGGMGFLQTHLPETHLTFTGGLSWQLIFVWGFLAFWTIVDPNFYARCYAAKDSATARKGILWAIMFWFIFDMMTLFAGLYARAAFPDADPLFAYFALSEAVLPGMLNALFIVGIFSIVMSTIDSFLFSSSTILASDFLKKTHKKKTLQNLTRIGIVFTLLLAIFLAWSMQSVIGIIYALGSVGVSALLLPMLLIFFRQKKLADGAVFASMISAAAGAGAWMTHGWLNAEYGWPVYMWSLEPMYVGLAISAIILLLFQKKLFA